VFYDTLGCYREELKISILDKFLDLFFIKLLLLYFFKPLNKTAEKRQISS
jgi:hypothetical protein